MRHLSSCILFCVLFIFTQFNSVYSQTFYDGFESGTLNNWSSSEGVIISSTYKHSGNYSAYFNVFPNGSAKLLKTNSVSSYVKVSFYVYLTTWQDWTGFQVGGNGLTWFTNFWSDDKVYIWNCNHIDSYNTGIFVPMNYWNYVTVEKTSGGSVRIWINGNQVLNGFSIGTCNYMDITLALASWGNNVIKGYIDDVRMYYEPTAITSISTEIPKEYQLSQNYPNPFNPQTIIRFSLPTTGYAELKVYDVSGKEIETLMQDNLYAGVYEATFNALNYPSGVYFYKLTSNDFTQTKKMIVLK